MIARSAPCTAALSVSEPPMAEIWTSPEITAGMPVELAMLVSSTSRPCCLKMPASTAIHSGRFVAMGLLYETFSEAGAGVGAALAAVGLVAAVGAAAGAVVGAAAGAVVRAAGLAAPVGGAGAAVAAAVA